MPCAPGGSPSIIASCSPSTSSRSTPSMKPSAGSTRRSRLASNPFGLPLQQLTTIPGVGPARRARHRRRDRPRHEPLSHQRPSHLVGRPVPEERRECRQATVHPDAQRSALAQDCSRPVRLGRSAARKTCYLHTLFHRLRARRGAPKRPSAPSPPPSSLPPITCSRDGTLYQDLGTHHFERRDNLAQAKHLVARLHSLGYRAELSSIPSAPVPAPAASC